MEDEKKTKEQLISERAELRQRGAELEEAKTERKRAEEAPRQLKEFHESIVQNMSEGVVVEDAHGHITFVNPAALALLGYDAEELVGQHWRVIIPVDQQPIVKAADERRARGESDHYEVEVVRKDGARLSVLVHGSPRFEEEQFAGTIAVFTDMTERKRAEEEAQRRLERLEALREIDRAISSSLELKDRLDVLLDKLTELPHIDGVSVVVLNPDTEELETVAIRDLSEEFAEMARVRLRDGLPGLVAEREKPLVITDLLEDERVAYPDLLEREGLASYIGLPLLAKGELIGVLGIYSRERHLWSQEQSDFLHTLAGQAAIAIENARLYEGERRRTAHLTVINEVSRKAISILDLHEMLKEVARSICSGFNYYNVALFLVDKEHHEAVMEAVAGGFEHIAPGEYRQSLDQGIIGWVIRTGRSWLANDVSQDPYYVKGFVEEVLTKSELCVPIKLGEAVIGALNIQSIHLNAFDETDVTAMETLSGQIAIAIENTRTYERLETQNLETISALAAAVEAKDPYTSGHSEEVTQFAIAIAEKLGLSNDEIEDLQVAALLHDIGKIGIPDSVLNKPARLTSAEFLMIKAHPAIAAEIVGKIEALAHLVPIIRHHHERYDGQGYPDGLKGKNIPLGARILAVADGFEAMTSERPYRRARTEEEALAELQKGAGSQWDPNVVEVFVEVYEEGALRHQAGRQ